MNLLYGITIGILVAIDLLLSFIIFKMYFKFNGKIVKELEEKKNLLLENNELHDKNLIHAVIEMALLLKLNAFANDYQKFTEVYQQLYFLGVKKEILDNGDLLDDFISRLINKEFNIKLGEKPFMFDFTEKK